MCRIFAVIPLVVALIVSTSFPAASAVVGDAKTCAEVANEPQQLRVRIAGMSQFDETVVEQARREVETIWEKYHITIVWSDDRVEAEAVKPDLLVEFVPTMPTHSTKAIAWVLFTEGHPLPLVRVSIPAALRLLASAKSWFDGRPLTNTVVMVRDMALGRIVGRALAHEIGHFLLGSSDHARTGLMRAMIDAEQFVRPSLERFGLDNDDVRTLRAARIAGCELTTAARLERVAARR